MFAERVRLWMISLAVLVIILVIMSSTGYAQSADDVCRSSTWTNCGLAIKRELERRPTDPRRIGQLGELWGRAFSDQFDALRKQGRIETSTPDSKKIFDEVAIRLNPVEIAKDKTIEAILKRYLAGAATVLEWAEKPIAVAIRAFLNSSEIATDYQELRLMNAGIQKSIAALLEPHMRADWRQRLNVAVEAATPQLRRP